MSRKKDEEDAMGIVFMIIWISCSWAFGWVAGTIITFLSLIGMAFESTSSTSKKKSTKSVKQSKPTKSLFEIIEEDKKKAEEKKKQQLEKEMDDYGLSEEEKEIVRNSNGEYEPYQFDEEELEEDDYYSEDD